MEDKAVISLSVLQNSLFSIFSTCLWSVRTAVLFRYKGRLVTSQQKKKFLSPLHFCWPFGFEFIRMGN